NLSRAYGMIDDAAQKGAEIAVLPEMFFSPYEPVSIRSAAYLAERAAEGLRERAARHGIMIVAGSMPWRGDGRRFFNRSFVFGRSGEDLYQHDKIHLFDCSPPGGPSVMESDFIMPGDALGSFETPWGPASVIECYDIRFSPVAQILADKNIRLLFVPAAFSLSTGTAHWEILVRVRALEIQGFVVGVQPAHNPGLRYVPYGHSLISSPWGRILYDAGQEDAADVVNIDLSEIRDIRERFPLLAHRRRDLYTTSWLGGS
ncbi:MAG: carbon-nitrogen hydrolase family protein, partial [Bacteriovoracaceae bacterium]|nr:carbon-nitrogen hydrolase family protein [Bacteriovoracaceae bacterium]